MYRQNIIYLVISIFLAALLTYGVFIWVGSQKQTETQQVVVKEDMAEILVASDNLPTGKKLALEDLHWQLWPREALNPDFAIKGSRTTNDFTNAYVRWPIAKGQPILDTLLARPEHRGYLAALIQPGKRAVSVKVDTSTGVSGFISPGDHVDVILTQHQDRSARNYSSETLVQNVLVLGVDQTTTPANGKQTTIAKTITLEVSPRQAEKIARAKSQGVISLSLQGMSAEDQKNAEIDDDKISDSETLYVIRGSDAQTIKME